MAEHDFGSISTTGSVINLNLAAKWLYNCINHHTECPRELQSQSILPLRVLDIGLDKNSSRLYLSVGENRPGSYAALSYCWGEAAQVPLYVTTDDNIEARKKHIDAAILPKTFTDTINVCRHLGIRFLWIDSICIIQENEDDWRTQAAQMGNIYSKAKLTIAAAAGTNSDSGLFVDRDPRKTYPCPFTARYISKGGSVTTASFLSCRDLEEDKTGPLDSRGWAFQEMYLSARTLRFSAKGIHWVCASQNASEGLPIGQQPFNHKSDFDEFVNAGSYPSNSSPLDASEKYVWWYKAVQLYNKRCFSKNSDRLIALSGLASILQEELKDEYLFGLWKGNFLQGLAWFIDSQARLPWFVDSQAQELRPNKSSSMIAPSWSWASRAGEPIFYETPFLWSGEEESIRGIKSMHTIGESRIHIQHPLFEFLEGHPTLPNIYSKSSVIGSSLRIRGLVLRVWHRNSNLYAKNYDLTVSCPVPNNAGYSYLGKAKYDEPVDKDDILHCLPISFSGPPDRWTVTKRRSIMELLNIESKSRLESTPESGVNIWCGSNDPGIMLEGRDMIKCLILKKTGKIKQYRRVGYVELFGAKNFGEVKPVELEIV